MVELRLISSLAKVFPRSAPPSRPEKCWLSTLGGERVSFQAAYVFPVGHGARSWAHLRVEGPSDAIITVRQVRYIPGEIPAHFKTDDSYISTQGGLFPDLLEPYKDETPTGTSRLPLIPGLWQSCWIDVRFKEGTLAGHYPIKVFIESPDGEPLACAETIIESIPTELPALEIPRTQWFHTDCLATYYGLDVFSDRHLEIIENFAAYATTHGINAILTPIHTPPLDTEIGGERPTVQLIDVAVEGETYSFNFTKFERWVAMCKKIGIKYYEIAHLFTQWGAKCAPKIMGMKNGVYTKLFGWETDATGDEYANYLRQMIPALTAKLEALSIADKTIFHISDEPGEEHFDAYMAARKLVSPLLEGYKIVDALSNYEYYERGAVTVPIPSVDCITPFIEGNVPELWCYFCCAQSHKVPNHFFMQPSYRNRILGVLMYKYNIAGFLHWGYNFYYSVHSVYPVDPYRITDADGAFPSGDAYTVYPGADGNPLASLRLMVAQEGFNDFQALKLLEKHIGREAVLMLIDEGLAEPVNFSCFPQNEDYILNLRQAVNKQIAVHAI